MRIGDTVLIERAGDVIPYVVRVTKPGHPRQHEFAMRARCLVCGAAIVHEEGEVGYFCVNAELSRANARVDSPFRVEGGADVDGLGDKLVGQLVEKELVKELDDIFDLRVEQIAGLERMADKSAQNLIAAIERSRTVALDRVINGLGIRHVGEHTARQLALRFRTLEAVMDASEDDLRGCAISATKSRTVSASISRSRAIARRLYASPTSSRFAPQAPVGGRGALRDKSFVLTGTLESMSRDEAEQKILAAGGR